MRNLVIAVVLFGVANRGLGQESVVPTESRGTKIEHLLKAAEHLEAAGLTEEAGTIRQKADQERIAAMPGVQVPPHPLGAETPCPAGNQPPTVLLKVRILELSQTKLDRLGFSFQRVGSGHGPSILSTPDNTKNSSDTDDGAMAIEGRSPQSGVLASNDPFFGVLETLRKDGLAKVLAEPTIVTESNRSASFHCGGQFPIAVPQSNGTVNLEFKTYGTLVDFIPVVRADHTIHMECRVETSELDLANSATIGGTTVPGLRRQQIETAANCKPGQTVVLRGLLERRVSSDAAASDSANGAAPKADDQPKTKENVAYFETLVLLTPEIVEPMLSENAARTETRQ
jgi:pilus assembly protein CpaC